MNILILKCLLLAPGDLGYDKIGLICRQDDLHYMSGKTFFVRRGN